MKRVLTISIDRNFEEELRKYWVKYINDNFNKREKLSFSEFLSKLLRKGLNAWLAGL